MNRPAPTSRRQRPPSVLTLAVLLLSALLLLATVLGVAVAQAQGTPESPAAPVRAGGSPKVDAARIGAPEATGTTCVVPEGRVLARTAWRGATVEARPGALALITAEGTRFVTPCEGLPGPHAQALAVGPDGQLWVGFRQAGLFRYDGATFRAVAEVPGGAGVRVLLTEGAQVWVGTGGGLWGATARGDDFVAAPHAHRVLRMREVTALHRGRDGLYVALGPFGIWRVKPGAKGAVARTQRHFHAACFDPRGRALPPGPECELGQAASASGLPAAHATALAWHQDRLVVGLFDAGLAEATVAGSAPTRFAPVPTAPGGPRLVNALLTVGDTLYIGAAEGLFSRRGAAPVRPVPVRLPSHHVNGLAAGPDGTIWVAHSLGLTAIGPGGVRHLGVEAGLPDRIVYAVTVAGDGAVWAGTARGAVRFDAVGGVKVFDQARGHLANDWVTALLPADGAGGVWAGTYDAGLSRLDAHGGAPDRAAGALWINPAGLSRDGDDLYLATLGDGLQRYAPGVGLSPVAPVPGDDVTAALVGPDGVWVATRGGLAHRSEAASASASPAVAGPALARAAGR